MKRPILMKAAGTPIGPTRLDTTFVTPDDLPRLQERVDVITVGLSSVSGTKRKLQTLRSGDNTEPSASALTYFIVDLSAINKLLGKLCAVCVRVMCQFKRALESMGHCSVASVLCCLWRPRSQVELPACGGKCKVHSVRDKPSSGSCCAS